MFKIGKQHHNWSGDNVSYKGIHLWATRKFGRPQKCEHCEDIEKGKYCWANKSGEYKRDRSDWIRLCYKCHYAYDFGEKGNPNQKLSKNDIKHIKSVGMEYGMQRKLATIFNVNRATIKRVHQC